MINFYRHSSLELHSRCPLRPFLNKHVEVQSRDGKMVVAQGTLRYFTIPSEGEVTYYSVGGDENIFPETHFLEILDLRSEETPVIPVIKLKFTNYNDASGQEVQVA